MKWTRLLATVSMVGVMTGCTDSTENNIPAGMAKLALQAVAPPSLARFAPALVLGQIHATVRRFNPDESSDLLLDRTVEFNDNTTQLSLELNVSIPAVDTLYVELSYETAEGLALFTAGDYVIVTPGKRTVAPAIEPFYVGPGANIAFMSMNGDDTVVTAGSTVQFDVTALDSAQAEVTQFYLSWSTSDPRVTVDPHGLVATRPGVTQEFRVFARTPSGVETSTLVTVEGDDDFALSPDSVELRPGQTQSFQVTIGLDVGTNWTAGGVVGGDSAHGFISTDGLYIAPPTPLAGGETQVCIHDSDDPTSQGCAKVRVPAVPTVGADVVVVNDLNLFDSLMLRNSGNRRFVRNLVNTVGSGPRADGRVVWSDRGRDSRCVPPADTFNECGDSAKREFFSEIRGQGYSLVSFDGAPADLENIPSSVRAIIFWMPLLSFSGNEVNALKAFAGQGGRIIFIGENVFFYGDAGIAVENNLLSSLGSTMVNRGDLIDCIDRNGSPLFYTTPSKSLRTHPLMTGVSSLRYACGSEVQIGAADFPLFYDTSNTVALGGVAKISLEPLQFVRGFNPTLRIPAPVFDRPRGNSRGPL